MNDPRLPVPGAPERPERARPSTRSSGFTLVELLVVVSIVAILALIASASAQRAKVRANSVAARSNIRSLRGALAMYRTDHDAFPPAGPATFSDPFGVVADSALAALTTPLAYVSREAFGDPFGMIEVQGSAGGQNMFGFPATTVNPDHSLLYFHYPSFARMIGDPAVDADGFALVSLGPDHKDSFAVYFPFPERLPAGAAGFGVLDVSDTAYDPTNGTISRGDIAGFGGDLGVPPDTGGP